MKKICSIFTVLLLLLSLVLLAACSPSAQTTTAAPTATGQPTTSAKATTGSTTAAKKVTIRVLGMSNVHPFAEGENENNNMFINKLEEVTGYDIIWEIQPQENAKEKINLYMGSGNPPDLIQTGDREMILEYVNQKLLLPVDEYIKKAPNLLPLMTEDANKMITLNGKLYGLAIPQNVQAGDSLVVREDILKAAGVTTLPRTLADIKKALQAVKAYDPALIPLTGAGSGSLMSGVSGFKGAFGVANAWRVNGTQVEPTAITEDMRSLLTYLNDLYQAGLLDKEYAVTTGDKKSEKVVSGKAVLFSQSWSSMKALDTATIEKNAGAKLTILGSAIGPDGRKGMPQSAPVRNYLIIPVKSQVAQESINLLNAFVVKDVYTFMSFGIEGKHYTLENGIVKTTDIGTKIQYRIYYMLWDTLEAFQKRCKQIDAWQYYEPMISDANVSNPIVNMPVIPTYANNIQTLNDLQDQYFNKIITGALPVSAFDEFVAKYRKTGGDDVIKAVNEWYSKK